MTNKQGKILTNQVAQLEKEVNELANNCNNRIEVLARNDGIYQNLQGQLLEKRKRIDDHQKFLQILTSSNKVSKKDEPRKPGPTRKSKSDKKPEDE